MKFTILSIKEETDGSMSADVDFDEEMAEQIKSHYGVDEITPQVLSAVVKELIEQYVEQNAKDQDERVKEWLDNNPDEYYAEPTEDAKENKE